MKFTWTAAGEPVPASARTRATTWARPALPALVGLAAVVCALLAQHPGDPTHVPAWVIAASLFAIAGAAVALPTPVIFVRAQYRVQAEASGRVARCGAVLLLPALAAIGLWRGEPFRVTHTFTSPLATVGALLWLGGLLGALAVAWPARAETAPGAARTESRHYAEKRPSLGWPPVLREPYARLPRFGSSALPLALELAALAVIMVLAAALRTWHLATLPEGIWIDEADNALGASRLMHMPFQPLSPGNIDVLPCLYYYVMVVLMHIGGNTIAVVRLTSACFGLLAVLAVYLLGRCVGGAPLGLCAAALMAIAQWAVDFSRFGLTQITAPAMTACAFAALTVAMLRPRGFWFALAGILLGFSLLTYYGAFLPAVAVGACVLGLRVLLDGRFRRAAWPAMALLPAGLIAGAAPLIIAIWLDAGYTLGRFQTASLFGEYSDWAHRLAGLQANLHAHLLMFTIYGDRNGRHNLPGAPMLDAVTGACFLLGLGICLRRIHHWLYQLLLAWLVTTVLSGVLSLDFEAPQSARAVGAISPVMLIAALPLALAGRAVWSAALALPVRVHGRVGAWTRDDQSPASLRALIAAGLAAVAVALPLGVAYARNTNQYFVRQASDLSSWSAMGGLPAIVGREAAALRRQGYTVRIDPSMQGDPALVYAAGGLSPEPYDLGVPVPLPVPAGGLALAIPSDQTQVFGLVRRAYPRATVIPLTPNFDHTAVQANVILVRPSDVARNIGITATFVTGTRSLRRDHVRGAVAWPAGSGRTTTATLRGTLLISSAQSWQPIALRLVGAREATITIDGATWRTGRAGTPPLRLGSGNHLLVVDARGRAGSALQVQWTAPGGEPAGPGSAGTWSAVPALDLAATGLPTGGLLGLYFNGPAIAGQPALARVDQSAYTYFQNPPPNTAFPFAARWLGSLRIDRPGVYGFTLESVGPSQLYIDGRAVTASGAGIGSRTGTIALRRGRHSLRLDYSATGSYLHCYLTWAPPGQAATPIPPDVTLPAYG